MPYKHETLGCLLGQRLVLALAGRVGIPEATLSVLVYDELEAVAKEFAMPGDWLTFPNGTTYTLSFNPRGGDHA